jgi:dihydropteroate synthase type 2
VSVGPKVFGILNITEDSFSDGGRFLAPEAALAHARTLAENGADAIDLGAASSNPDAKLVAADIEIGRLAPVVAALKTKNIPVSIDSFSVEVQRWAIARDVDFINDIQGFPSPALYGELAEARMKLIVMHSVQGVGKATRVSVAPGEILDRVLRFFEARIAALVQAGISSQRLILDPGMGFFLGANPEASFTVLRQLPALKAAFGFPLLVSVSRKSFLRALSGRSPANSGPATLAAELFAIDQGADYIRTHDPGALRDAVAVRKALDGTGAIA